MKESNVQKLGMCAMSENNATMMRNNVGSYKDSKGNWIRYGVGGKGAADTLGWTEVVITPEMVGKTVAVFTSCEYKASKGGRLSPEQATWRDLILGVGGFAGVARNEQEAIDIIKNGIIRLKS